MLNKLFPALALAIVTMQPIKAALIDDFSLPTPATSFQITPDANPTTVTNNIGGGTTRTVTLTVTSTPTFNSLSGGIGSGFFIASFNALSQGTLNVDYAFATARDMSGDVALTMVTAAAAGFATNVPVVISLNTTGGQLIYTGILPTTNSLTENWFLFSNFTGSGNLAQVNGVNITFTGGQASSFAVDSVGTTPAPEPATALTLLLAAPALLALRRKQ